MTAVADPWDVDLDAAAERIESDGSDLVEEAPNGRTSQDWGGYIIIDDEVHLKPVLRNGRGGGRAAEMFVQAFCDVASARVAQLVNAPVPPSRLVVHPDLGVSIITPWMEGDYSPSPHGFDWSQLANADDLPVLYTFLEWVLYGQHRAEHIIITETVEGPKAYHLDFGRTLNRGTIKTYADEAVERPGVPHTDGYDIDARGDGSLVYTVRGFTDPPVARSIRFGRRGTLPVFGLTSIEDVQPGIDAVQAATEAEIREAIDDAVNQLHRVGDALQDHIDTNDRMTRDPHGGVAVHTPQGEPMPTPGYADNMYVGMWSGAVVDEMVRGLRAFWEMEGDNRRAAEMILRQRRNHMDKIVQDAFDQ